MNTVEFETLPHFTEHLDRAVNTAMATYLGYTDVNAGKEIGELADAEFLELLQDSSVQPINPARAVAKALGLNPDDEHSNFTLMEGLHQAQIDNIAHFKAMGLDPQMGLFTAETVQNLTEGYITGYSSKLSVFATDILRATNGAVNGPFRWIRQVWVPCEDRHDKLLLAVQQASPRPGLARYYDLLTKHLPTPLEVDTERTIDSFIYLAEQEKLTQINYYKWAKFGGPAVGELALLIGKKEAGHTRAYESIVKELFLHYPEEVIVSVDRVHTGFAMPGKAGIDGFEDMERLIAISGVLDIEDIVRVKSEMVRGLGIHLLNPDDYTNPDTRKSIERLQKKYNPEKVSIAEKAMKKSRQPYLLPVKSGDLPPAILGVNFDAKIKGLKQYPLEIAA